MVSQEVRAKPLQGVRVINLGWVWVGAAMGQILGDMGAEVIRIESRSRYDISRSLPPFIEDLEGLTYGNYNGGRNQRSALLNLRERGAVDLLKGLVAVSDVVVDNYRPGTMQGWGLDSGSLRAANPAVIALSCSAAGQTGPLSRIATYGSNVSALAGIDRVQGFDTGPIPAGISILDPFYASAAVYAIMVALENRRHTGRGQYIDFSQWELTASMMSGPLMDYAMNGRRQGPIGNRDPVMAPHGVYRCRGEDAWVCIAVRTDAQWGALCQVMGGSELANDPRFADGFRRLRAHDSLDDILNAWTRERDKWEVALALQAAGVPAFPHLSDAETFRDRHFWERGTWVEMQHPVAGRKVVPCVPWRLSDTPGGIDRTSATLGEDNGYAFRELLGLSPEKVDELELSKVAG